MNHQHQHHHHQHRRRSRWKRWAVRCAGLLVLAGSLALGWVRSHHNFDVVRPGAFYRSGQMPAPDLARVVREHGIKTVLNLRGPNVERWYLEERSAALSAGAAQIDVPMSSCIWMSRDQLRMLVQTIETAERPILVHCQWGAERTGLASAIAELLRPGSTLEDARRQFSVRYLFVRLGDGKIMAEHLDQYENWLDARGLAHSPETFRKWTREGFRPGKPGREEWPYDPYPLVVVTRPGPAQTDGSTSGPAAVAERGAEGRTVRK